ncbi:MAG: carbohydrate kinase family protein [Promethearchaeota archaeon]
MILSVGHINIDWICTVPQLPGPDDKVAISNLSLLPGGGAGNFVVSVSRLGSKAAFFGHVGKDSQGKEALRTLAEEGVDVSRVIQEKDLQTGFVIILVDNEGQTMKIRYLGANSRLSPKEITPKLLEGADVVHISGGSAGVAMKVSEVCQKRGIKSSFDVSAEFLAESKSGAKQRLNSFSFVFMSQGIFEQTFDLKPKITNVQAIVKGRNEVVNVTLGTKGAFAATSQETLHQPIFKVEAIDTTGAGDAYAGAFIHYYMKKLTLAETMKRAAACAALQTTQYGGRAGCPTGHEIEEFLKQQNR